MKIPEILMVETVHQPGSLAKVLQVIAEAGLNLIKLESRPIQGKPWDDLFYADLRIPEDRAALIAALRAEIDYLRAQLAVASSPAPRAEAAEPVVAGPARRQSAGKE